MTVDTNVAVGTVVPPGFAQLMGEEPGLFMYVSNQPWSGASRHHFSPNSGGRAEGKVLDCLLLQRQFLLGRLRALHFDTPFTDPQNGGPFSV